MRIAAGITAIVFASTLARADDDGDKVKVEVRGDADALLEQATIGHFPAIDWKTLCAAPCTVQLPGDATVRATSNGLTSEPIQLEHRDTILRADVPSLANASTGSTLVVLGGIVLAYSAIAFPVGIGLELNEMCFMFCNGHVDHTTADWLAASGGISALVGATLLGAGFSMKNAARPKLTVSSRGVALNMTF